MLKITNLYKTFFINKKPIPILNKVNLEIPQYKIFGLVGATGSGKTTLLQIMNGLVKPDKKENTIIEKKFKIQESGTIWQSFNLLYNLNIFDNVSLPLKIRNWEKEKIQNKVLEVLRFVGLSDFIKFYPRQLSGGQKQRVAIARTLVYEPKIIFCDEPTSSLNEQTSKNILKLFYEINKKLKTTIVIISHDSTVIKTLCDLVAVLNKGTIERVIDLKPSYNFEFNSYQDIFINKNKKSEIID
ncbi:D-methionine transport system ATP-binding protein [Candidatus Phytoplasma luffae]|uniref:D-methionine transport system ATP-binding protein n=1 Tax=Loofah witches'-broom phytoplasma TaxID=35773 RepID=A0A975ILN5_LOWBP|nr:ATP-binding cassette domain-containing protein [Candidatus Phytoplasma luffae]QTX02587.1 D-methionine transport system ATP-binding protein [Candidatus Phytoplasma luffae]